VRAIDHHCHPLLRWPGARSAADLRAAFSEAADPRVLHEHTPSTAAYRGALRRLADELGCEASDDGVLAARRREDPARHADRLLRASGAGMLLLDHGFGGLDAFTPAEHRLEVRLPQREVVRLETVAEGAAGHCERPEDWFGMVRAELRRAVAAGAVAVKTIVGYRAGLRLHRPDGAALHAAWTAFRAAVAGRSVRLTDRALCHALVFEAAAECTALGVPLQVHCGFGDPDGDLAHTSPLGLRPLLSDPRLEGLRLMLLHCYPYHREAAWMCSVYPDVYMDLSLALPLAAVDGARAMAEALGLCPWSKLLYATDATRLPEAYFVAAALHREALAGAMAELVGRGILDEREAEDAGRRVLAGNAARVYTLPEP
jgi:predicted TIM-barrel fold metal-dependent hydrolase